MPVRRQANSANLTLRTCSILSSGLYEDTDARELMKPYTTNNVSIS